MNTSNYIGIIADDLTGANDTSLQFFVQGCKTQVAFGEEIEIEITDFFKAECHGNTSLLDVVEAAATAAKTTAG